MVNLNLQNCNFTDSSNMNRDFILNIIALNPNFFLGDPDAIHEWTANREKSSKIFIHTDSFEIFKRVECLFLLGRRGTGKTAMIKMLDFEIAKSVNKTYCCSYILSQDYFFPKLTMLLRGEVFSHLQPFELRIFIKNIWEWIVACAAMTAVYERQKEAELAELEPIGDYLREMKVSNNHGSLNLDSLIFQKIIELLHGELLKIKYSSEKVAQAITILTSKLLHSDHYIHSFNCLKSYLSKNKKKCLVLIDSKETYQFNDPYSLVVTSSLIDFIIEAATKSSESCIYSKAAFPSEMYNYFDIENIGKFIPKAHFIRWRYKDLVCFIAKRCFAFLNELRMTSGNITYENLNDFDTALDFFNRNFSAFVDSYSGIRFDSIPYILSHTQKNPRQVMHLLNTILSLAEKNNIPYEKITSNCIVEGVHVKISDLAEEVYNMYSKIFSNGRQIIEHTFKESNNILRLSEIHEKMKEINSLLGVSGLDRDKAIALFVECGLIGIVQECKPAKKSGEGKQIMEVQFEYQKKDILVVTNKDFLAIHPMFYQPLCILVDNNSLIYPKPAEDELEEKNHLFKFHNKS